jgi:hypothetical protein
VIALTKQVAGKDLTRKIREGAGVLGRLYHKYVGGPCGLLHKGAAPRPRDPNRGRYLMEQAMERAREIEADAQAAAQATLLAAEQGARDLEARSVALELTERERRRKWLIEADPGELNSIQLAMQNALAREEKLKAAEYAKEVAAKELADAKDRGRKVLDAETYEAVFKEKPIDPFGTGSTGGAADRLPGMVKRQSEDAVVKPGLPPATRK